MCSIGRIFIWGKNFQQYSNAVYDFRSVIDMFLYVFCYKWHPQIKSHRPHIFKMIMENLRKEKNVIVN